MDDNQLINTINIHLKNIGLSRFDEDMNYNCIVSPFTRIYLITQGHGTLHIGEQKVTLEPGYLYLAPSFTSCSYHFDKGLEHYYVHFSTQLLNGLNIYHLFNTHIKVGATTIDLELLKRLHAVNPEMKLPSRDPNIYQAKAWLSKSAYDKPLAYRIESKAIIELILSRFICGTLGAHQNELLQYNLAPILKYIQDHLQTAIAIPELAKMAHLSPDHFSRIFKKVLGMAPGEFIISKRIEKAKLLLLTTDKPLKLIIEEAGFSSLAYFSRTFKKHTAIAPLQYRKLRG